MRRTQKRQKKLSNQGCANSPAHVWINTIPQKVAIKKGNRTINVRIKPPKYVDIKDLPKDPKHPFAEIGSDEDCRWLQSFSEFLLTYEKDEQYPLTNPKLDYLKPAISGFRIYLEHVGIVHIQVSRIEERNSMFQLNYYEIETKTISGINKSFKKFKVVKRWNEKKTPINPKVLMVIVVDINDHDFNSVNIVYASSALEIMKEEMSKEESDKEYAVRAALFFRYVQVFMRAYDYEESNVSTIRITPFEVFGKKLF